MPSRFHRAIGSPTVETSDQIARRLAWARAGEMAVSDREAVFPELTHTNAVAAIKFQEERRMARYGELMAADGVTR